MSTPGHIMNTNGPGSTVDPAFLNAIQSLLPKGP